MRVPFLAVALLAAATTVGAQCGDGIWTAGSCESCGRDAYQVTGHAEMNHDCVVDVADFALFAQEYGHSGFSPADLTRDGWVNSFDFAAFGSSYFGAPFLDSGECEPCGAGRGCAATARISFSPDPSVDLDQIAIDPFQMFIAHIVVQDAAGLGAFVGCIEASDNVALGSIQYGGSIQLTGGGTGLLSPWPDGQARIAASVSGWVTDGEPAAIRIVGCPGHPQSPLSWGRVTTSQTLDFAVVAHGGINGPAPGNESACAGTPVRERDAPSSPEIRVVPNPARGPLRFVLPDLPAGCAIRVTVLDVAGRLVRVVHEGAAPAAGGVRWDAARGDGHPAAAGIYFVRLEAGPASTTGRFVLGR